MCHHFYLYKSIFIVRGAWPRGASTPSTPPGAATGRWSFQYLPCLHVKFLIVPLYDPCSISVWKIYLTLPYFSCVEIPLKLSYSAFILVENTMWFMFTVWTIKYASIVIKEKVHIEFIESGSPRNACCLRHSKA